MSNTLLTRTGATTLDPIVLDITPHEFYSIPKRSYDFNKGDRRFNDLERATAHAHEVASKTGVRQLVRPDTESLGVSLFVVQAVGS